MALPDVHFEVFYDGQWNEHIQDVAFESSDLTVQYGQNDEHGEAEPTDISCKLDNRENDWSIADPTSPAWGRISRGTRCRVRVGDPNITNGLLLPGVAGARAGTPSHASLNIAGDLDVRIDISPKTWRPKVAYTFAGKWIDTGGQRSWIWYLLSDGTMRFAHSPDGLLGAMHFHTCNTALNAAWPRRLLRVTVDVNNGASGHDIRFYTGDTSGTTHDLNGAWTQIGSTITAAGTTSFLSVLGDLAFGADSEGAPGFNNASLGRMTLHQGQLRNGIDGTIVANPNFTALQPEDREVIDSAGRTWTLFAGTGVVDTSVRGTAAMTKMLPEWDVTGLAALMDLSAGGILEQMGHGGAEAPRSSLYRDLSVRSNIVAYWPVEDGSGAQSFAAGRPGVAPMQPQGSFSPGGSSAFAAAAPVATFDQPNVGDSGATGEVPPYAPTARQRWVTLVSAPDGGVSSTAQLVNAYCTGTVRRISVNINSAGSLALIMRDVDGNSVLDTGFTAFLMNGRPAAVTVLLTQNGANINYQLGVFFEDTPGNVFFVNGTVNSRTYGRFVTTQLGLSPDLSGTALCHQFVINDDRDGDIWDIMGSALTGWAGERSLERVVRLCRENGTPTLVVGGVDASSEAMGAQGVTDFPDLFDECGAAELGMFGERRDDYALLARGRADLYSQQPALILDMRDGAVSSPFESPFDTQGVRNDVTVTRVDGSSHRATKTVGANSTADPPAGLGGSFPSTPSLNIQSDDRLPDQATFRLHLGTTEQPRVPKLEIEMEHNEDLVDDILALQRGDIILLQNAGDLNGMPPGDLRLMFLGSTDTITDQTWHVVLNCAPGDPWTIGAISDGSDDMRFDTDGSIVQSTNFVAGTSTSLSVAVTAGPLWTTDGGEFPFGINADGAILTVTGISGSSSPQTFTVSTTVQNGVTRLIPQGRDVRLANPTIVGL